MGKGDWIKKFFRENFFSGMLVVIPILVTVYVLVNIIAWLYEKLVFLPIVPETLTGWLSNYLPEWIAAGITKSAHAVEFGLVLAGLIALTALVGMITKIRLINWMIGVGERILARIPLIGVIYSSLKQLLTAVFSGKGNFSRVVMVEFPRSGLWSLGFISREVDRTLAEKAGKKMMSIFIPTTPNITTGFLIMAAEEDIINLDFTVEQAFKIIMSGGMVLPHEEVEPLQEAPFMQRIKERSGRSS